GMFIEPQENDLCRIGTPPVGAKVSATVKLFLIDPIQTSIQNFRIAIAGQCVLALRDNVLYIKIVAANKTNHLPVGTKAFADFFFRIVGQTDGAVAPEFVIEEIVCLVD